MKCKTDDWRILLKAVDQNITHAEEQGLPLVSIELDPGEWADFVIARTTLTTGERLDTQEFDSGTAIYRGIKIFSGRYC